MGWFKGLNTFARLMAAFALLGLILAAVGWLGVSQLGAMQANTDDVYNRQLLPLVALSDIQNDVQRIRQDSYKMFTPIDAKEAAAVVESARALDRDLVARIDRFGPLVGSEEERASFNRFREAAAEYRRHREERQYPLLLAGDKEGGFQGAKDGAPKYEAAIKELNELIAAKQDSARKQFESSQAAYRFSFGALAALVVVGLIFGQVLGVVVARRIGHTVTAFKAADAALQGLAQGDLSTRMKGECKGDHARIQVAFNTAARAMAEAVGPIDRTASELGGSSEELAAVSRQLSAGAEETSRQASSVSAAAEQVSRNAQAVATSVEEMSATVNEIAQNAGNAARVAAGAVRAAESANATVAKLGESSAEVGNVVKVVASVAEQTKLLALNATIEAARAGEAGKGFAVVANEVKELAKETARATEDIGQKIEAIQRDARGAAGAITQIGSVVHQIHDMQATIASAVEEQTATTNEIARNIAEAAQGGAEISRGITEVAQALRGTAEGASQTRQAAGELARVAAELGRLVGRFRGAGDEGPAPEPPVAPSRAANRNGTRRHAHPPEASSPAALAAANETDRRRVV